ncbi:flagellar protein FlaG [Pelagibius litoralis]|uniref:Flagellar protein FlaG n=1 Tax=Pelagibius litoralis TaxID=374515 RepID=A0A967EXY9_9PROT|nr:flagellar protein FlaG [Pelagibius litoralis]NIA69467.1 flagellar protein FlaG [Pelagibius litoralis]
MDTKLLASTTLVAPQSHSQTRSSVPAPSVAAGEASGKIAAAAAVSGPVSAIEDSGSAAAGASIQNAVLRQSAPNSALTTYRDQESGRLIVRVYDRESGDVLVEFPPEKAFRPAGNPPASAVGKPRTTILA